MKRRLLIGAALFALVPVLGAMADQLQTTDGKEYQGRLIKRDDKQVSFEVVWPSGAKAVITVDNAKVASLTTGPITSQPTPAKESKFKKPAAPPIVKYGKPTYYLVPLKGKVGMDIVASLLEESFEDALKRKPDVVVLEVDSPGGEIHEAEKIVKVIGKYSKSLRIVSFVDEGLSAAAIISLSTKDIYVKPSASIGAAVAYTRSATSKPTVLEEKFMSAWRAVARSSAEMGGHSPLLANAMIDNNYDLQVVESGGKKEIKEGTGPKTILKKGQILTLTADESLACGLSAGKADDLKALGKLLGHEDWQECVGVAGLLVEYRAKLMKEVSGALAKMDKDVKSYCNIVNENDPGRFRYEYFEKTGQFTGASKAKWRTQSAICVTNLAKVEDAIKQAISLCSAYDELSDLVELLKQRLAHYQGIKAEYLQNTAKLDK